MYAYGGRQMERDDSVHSLSSRGGSDLGSRYTVESGIYMTSFAAAVFVAGLVTAGVLLLTLLITLTVMLQSCQTKNAGVIEMYRSSDDYNYCKNFALNLELNGLNVDSLPSFCENVAIKYIKEGQYTRELNITVSIVENYLSSRRPLGDGLDVVLVDVDDFLPSDYSNLFRARFSQHVDDFIEEAKHVKRFFFQQLCMKIKAGGWSLILLSRKPEKLRNATIEHLISTGFGGWSSLIMRLDDEMQMNSSEYFSKQRTTIQEEGFRITAVISCQMDSLIGPYLGKHIFKLPNPIYYNTHHYY